eukprot:2670467-Pyramimonas_sp.AAC.1
MPLKGVLSDDGSGSATREPTEVLQSLSRRWGAVFGISKAIDESAAQQYLDRFGPHCCLRDLPPPSRTSLEMHLKMLNDSEPGPDGLAYSARLYNPLGIEILDKALWHVLNGGRLLPSFNHLRGAFIAKGSRLQDEEE